MSSINPISVNSMALHAPQNIEFEDVLTQETQRIAKSESAGEDEVIYNDAQIADMIVANGVISESIRQMRENEQKLKEILDEA
ncbi:hypothetical protein AL542_15715 [Grimontia hollisae]|nr:hypothetical protein [Grimontia hollisae]AMG31635.1 hypothetical protein AL542_15715 [Grimontia hollisae]STO45184.1 Uncharacterised protein [Grimontia hollisae]